MFLKSSEAVLLLMNPAVVAAIIKKYGTHLAGGEYEIFVSLADVQSIPVGSGMREYQERPPQRGRPPLVSTPAGYRHHRHGDRP